MNDRPIDQQHAEGDIYNIMGDLQVNQSHKLADIDRQLTDLYLPMEDYLREYMDIIKAASFNNNLLRMDLRRNLEKLETKYPGAIDTEVLKFWNEFFKEECPIEVFRAAVSKKVRNLREKRLR